METEPNHHDIELADPNQIDLQMDVSDKSFVAQPIPRPSKPVKIEVGEEVPPCRICMENNMSDPNNPLINPCDCRGTQGLIHVDCLRHWIDT